MAFHPKTLVVYANPFCAVDHKGRPAGAFPEDPDCHPGMSVFVGAKRRVCDETGDVVWDFEEGPIEIPNTLHHKHAVMHGTTLCGAQLIAGDEVTAKECGIAKADLKSVDEVRAFTKKAVLERWQQENDGCTALEVKPAKSEATAPAPSTFTVPTGATLPKSSAKATKEEA